MEVRAFAADERSSGAVPRGRGRGRPLSATLPRRLRPGDTVAVVSPSGPVLDADLLDQGIAALTAWGLRVAEGAHARGRLGHLAGTDPQRAADINAAIADPAVRAMWATRGGYGLTRILDRIDWYGLVADVKLLVGFSDVTALHVAAWQRIRLVTVHGHVVGQLARQPSAVRERLRAIVFGADRTDQLIGVPLPGADPSVVRGPLVGGNLTVLAALTGTAHQLDARGAVLLLEEVGEAPYRVDRSLTQLRDSGVARGVIGVAVGAPVRCDPPVDRPSATFAQVLADRLGDLGVPVVTDLPIGHVPGQHAVLHGADVVLDGRLGTLTPLARLPDVPRR